MSTVAIEKEIEQLIKNNMKFRFDLELSKTSEEEKERREQIVKIIANLDYKQEEPKTSEKRQKMFDDIEKQIYKQPWHKMRDHHKEVKLSEFVNEVYKDHKEKDNIMKLIMKGLANGDLKNEKGVIYDSFESKIKEIVNLKENDGIFVLEKKVKAKQSANNKQIEKKQSVNKK
jgi:hypothetical protein